MRKCVARGRNVVRRKADCRRALSGRQHELSYGERLTIGFLILSMGDDNYKDKPRRKPPRIGCAENC